MQTSITLSNGQDLAWTQVSLFEWIPSNGIEAPLKRWELLICQKISLKLYHNVKEDVISDTLLQRFPPPPPQKKNVFQDKY